MAFSQDGDEERQRLLSSPQTDNGTISAEAVTPPKPQSAENEDHTTRQLIWMLSGPCIGGFISAVDSTLVGTLGGAISSSLGDLRLLSWLGSSFFIATCVSQPIIGKITDIYGRKQVLLVANVVFCLGNLMCALTQTEHALLIGRVVAGLGGGCIGPITAFIMSDIIPLRRRGVWQGAGNICYGIGSGIGGPLGGWIVQALDWRWAFAFQVPITILTILLIILALPETAPAVALKKVDHDGDTDGSQSVDGAKETNFAKLRRVDFSGSLTLAAFLVLLLLGLNTGGNILPWSSPLVIASLCASVIFLGLFIFVESYVATEPILELRLFANRSLTAAWLTNWFASMARFGLLFYGPLLFQAQGFSVAETGLRFLPESIAIVIASISCGAVMRATGKHYWLGIGVVSLQMLGLTLVACITAVPLQASTLPSWTAFIFLFINGFGYSGMLTTTLIAMIAAAEQKWQAVITSTSYAFRSTGTVIGITIASVVFQSALQSMLRDQLKGRSDADALLRGVQRDLHFIDGLDEPLQSDLRSVYIAALRVSFYALLGLAGLALVSVSFVREHKLHKSVSRRD